MAVQPPEESHYALKESILDILKGPFWVFLPQLVAELNTPCKKQSFSRHSYRRQEQYINFLRSDAFQK